MAALRGERFHIDLSDDETDNIPGSSQLQNLNSAFGNLVKDVQEKPVSGAKAPIAPTLSNRDANRGFPAHKKRVGVSRFKAARAQATDPSHETREADKPSPEDSKSSVAQSITQLNLQEERRAIDEENRKRLAAMSPAEIEKERRDIMSSLSPALLKRLLARATIDDAVESEDFPGTGHKPSETTMREDAANRASDSSRLNKSVAFADLPEIASNPSATETSSTEVSKSAEPDDMSQSLKTSRQPEREGQATDEEAVPILTPLSHESTHFPRPPQPPPDLDPDSPDFLQSLHEKYFASLPQDPSKLSWMQDTGSVSTGDAYAPSELGTIDISKLRFDFSGRLLPPSVAETIPTTAGLHHHADSPSSAGYTVPELAHLARSSVAAQRCIAYQLLGRLLYRLGLGEFGDGEPESGLTEQLPGLTVAKGSGSRNLEAGLWNLMGQGRVLETLQHEASQGRHASARAYATEALWLWQRGGGKKVRAE